MREYNEEVLLNKVGGKFKLSALIQKRLRELYRGDKPLVSGKFSSPMDIVLEEILQDKINLEPASEEVESPEGETQEEIEGEIGPT